MTVDAISKHGDDVANFDNKAAMMDAYAALVSTATKKPRCCTYSNPKPWPQWTSAENWALDVNVHGRAYVMASLAVYVQCNFSMPIKSSWTKRVRALYTTRHAQWVDRDLSLLADFQEGGGKLPSQPGNDVAPESSTVVRFVHLTL